MLKENNRTEQEVKDEEMAKKYRVISDDYVFLDMIAAGFEYLMRVESDFEPNKYYYVFTNSEEITQELSHYPSNTYWR